LRGELVSQTEQREGLLTSEAAKADWLRFGYSEAVSGGSVFEPASIFFRLPLASSETNFRLDALGAFVDFDGEGFHDFRIAFDGDDDGSLMRTVAGGGESWEDLAAIRER